MTFAVVWLAVITAGEYRGAERGEVAEQHRIDGVWLSMVVLVVLAAWAAVRFGVATRFYVGER